MFRESNVEWFAFRAEKELGTADHSRAHRPRAYRDHHEQRAGLVTLANPVQLPDNVRSDVGYQRDQLIGLGQTVDLLRTVAHDPVPIESALYRVFGDRAA